MKYKNFFLRAVNLLLILGVLRYFWLFSLSFVLLLQQVCHAAQTDAKGGKVMQHLCRLRAQGVCDANDSRSRRRALPAPPVGWRG